MLDGVTRFQAKWRGAKARHILEEHRFKNYYRAWSLEVMDVDGLPDDSEVANGDEAQAHPAASYPSRACYQVVVTVIQDLLHVGIKESAPPVQLFRFDTPVVPISAAGVVPAYVAGITKVGSRRSPITKGPAGLLKSRSTTSAAGVANSPTPGTGTVQFNSEMFVPGSKPWTTVILTVVKTVKKAGQSKPLTAKDWQGVTAGMPATASPPEIVGQGFLNLKDDLCRGTSRTLCLPLGPQQFPVEDFRMKTTADHVVPEGLTICARLTPLSDVTSKCGFIHVAFWSGSANGPVGRTSKCFALLVGSMLLLYRKASSRMPPKARLALKGAGVWAKTALLQVLVSLRTPDDLGRTNFQINAPSLEELKAWRSRIMAASSDDGPPEAAARRWVQDAGRNCQSSQWRLNRNNTDRKCQASQRRLMLTP